MVEEGSILNTSETHQYQTKGFIRWGIWSNIGITVFLSMSILFFTMGIGMPIFISTIVFVGVMFGIIYLLSGKINFSLGSDGIRQEVTPNWKKIKKVDRFFTWDDIRAYERGKDWNRSKQEFRYLYIDVNKDPGQLRISDDKGDKEKFAILADAFEQLVTEVNHIESPNRVSQPKTKDYSESTKQVIKHKRDFYQRPIAKYLTIFFIIITLFFISFGFGKGMRGVNWFRLLIIIIPGTIYMVYRVFYKKK
jgi:hypothetical protein